MLLGFLLVLLVLVCIALGAVILMQRSEGGAFGMGGGPSGLLTARGAGDLLTRTTSILAGVFFTLCLLLTILSGHVRSGESVVDRLKVDALNPDALNKSMRPAGPAPVAPSPGAPATTTTTTTRSATPARSSFDAPAPEVHAAPSARASTPPAVTSDSGSGSNAAKLLGYQSAPQASPTVAPPATGVPVAPNSAH